MRPTKRALPLWICLALGACSNTRVGERQEAVTTPGVIVDGVSTFASHFGTWQPVGSTRLDAVAFVDVTGGTHAEAQAPVAQGADLTFSADVTFGSGGEANLQARISDEGRYGVSVRESGVRIYRQLFDQDQLVWADLGVFPGALAAGSPHHVAFTLDGQTFTVTVDGVSHQVTDTDAVNGRAIVVGRLGLYAFRQPGSGATVSFANVRVTTDPTRKSNFALLYDTIGYEAAGSKRALLRTINPVASLDLVRSRFLVHDPSGAVVLSGALRRLSDGFGMQLWEADFSSLTVPGRYTLSVEAATSAGVQQLASAPFSIGVEQLSGRLLRGLTVLDAEARSAAAEDLRRNWQPVSGSFTVDPDGSFVARGADRGNGILIERIQDGFNGPMVPFSGPFSVTGQVTILDGCDAQIQFGFRGSERFAVTLQAGGPDCYGGSGAVRLHRESANPSDFTILAAHLLDATAPFVRGHAYDVLITSDGSNASVQLDGQSMIGSTRLAPLDVNAGQTMLTKVGLKAWGGSARFDRVGWWRAGVSFDRVVGDDGKSLLSPKDENGRSCDGSDAQADYGACAPLHHQRHGLNDCNNWIGESNSHGPFLVGLLAAYHQRGAMLTAGELDRLRSAILTTYGYLEELYREARGNGRFKHQEYGRGEMTSDVGKPWLTASGLYGEAAFAVDGADIDAGLAKTACRHAWQAAVYLDDALTGGQKALFLHQIATCARRDPTLPLSRYVGLHLVTYTPDQVDAMAIAAGTQFVQSFATGLPDGLPGGVRDSGLNLPWLEGIAALRWAYPQQTAAWDTALGQIADTLLALLGPDGSGDGFQVVPQASGLDQAGNLANWTDLASVPRSVHPIAGGGVYDGRDSYDTVFFATTAYDLVQLGRLTGRRGLERLAAGHLGWTLGLNPGVPIDKATGALVDDGTVWKSVAFIRGLAEPHARGFENWASGPHIKPVEPGEDGDRHREVWFFSPLLNGFLSIVNGEPIWEGQWDYHSMGYNGWGSAETFALTDGAFVKSMIAYEDWVACAPKSCPASPSCGELDDGCGHTLDCGACAAGQRCGGAAPNQCCQPTSCAVAGAACGALDDGCGGRLDCGGCPSGQSCGVTTANQCEAACVPRKIICRTGQCATFDDGCGSYVCCGGAHCCM